ncbi:nucleoside triphosphate pyrophosphohydrolase family protein [Nocardia takedensis]
MVDLAGYQAEAWRYDQQYDSPERALTIALLGLAGEVGTLQTSQKKIIRDGPVHLDHNQVAMEDLGDILWYVADVATWLGADLNDVAEANLRKIAGRWSPHEVPMPNSSIPVPGGVLRAPKSGIGPARVFDGNAPDGQRLPRQLEVHVAAFPCTDGSDHSSRVVPVHEGQLCGDPLGDNAYDEDGYRYHDIFHLAYLTILGWSPVVRALLKRKRKSDPIVDDVEDGGRAIAIEEGLSAFVFEAGGRANYFDGAPFVDSEILRLCRRMTANLEVSECTELEWEHAILEGFQAWRTIKDAGHAAVTCDLDARSLSIRPLTTAELDSHRLVCERAIAD